MRTGRFLRRSPLPLAALALACGGDATGGGVITQPPGGVTTPGTLNIDTATVNSGDEQTGVAGAALPNPLRVVVTRSGSPVSGRAVTWAASSGGSVAPTSSATGTDGIASTAWTLGPTVGTQTATATLTGAAGSPVTFTATATSAGGATPNTIQLSGTQFVPSTLTVPAGTTVTFQWVSNSHNVHSDGPPSFTDDQAIVGPPHSLAVRFDTPGVYRFHCDAHGGVGTGMNGTITVQ